MRKKDFNGTTMANDCIFMVLGAASSATAGAHSISTIRSVWSTVEPSAISRKSLSRQFVVCRVNSRYLCIYLLVTPRTIISHYNFYFDYLPKHDFDDRLTK